MDWRTLAGLRAPREALQYLDKNARPQNPRSYACSKEGCTETTRKWCKSASPAVVPTPNCKWPSPSCEWEWAADARTWSRTNYLRQLLSKWPTAVPSTTSKCWTTASTPSTCYTWRTSTTISCTSAAKSTATSNVQQWPTTAPSRASHLSSIPLQQLRAATIPTTCCPTASTSHAPAFPDKFCAQPHRSAHQCPSAAASSSARQAFRAN